MKKQSDHTAGRKPVSSIMTSDYAVVRDSLDVESLTKFLLERKLTCAAVADAGGVLIGYVSMTDLVRERYMNGETSDDADARAHMRHDNGGELRSGFHLEAIPRANAKDIMMPFVVRLPVTASIDEAASLMASQSVHRVLIVSATGEILGIVSALDVLKWVAWRDGYPVAEGADAQWRSSCEYATK